MPDPVIPVICGPTASGKTHIAVELARELPLEIVSADSRQVVKYLDIGTGKPTSEEKAVVRFHLIDLVEPGERYSAFRFLDDAQAAFADIISRGKLPVVVGGTGLYLRALVEGVVEIEKPDMEIRDQLERELADLGAEHLYKLLRAVDPLEAAKVHPNNHVRLIRALEMFRLTGVIKSELLATGRYRKSSFRFKQFNLNPNRTQLYQRIDKRVEEMFEQGLIAEVQELIDKGYREAIVRHGIIGYAETVSHLDGVQLLEDTVRLVQQNTRRYAKRQMTWFRHQTEAESFTSAEALKHRLLAECQ